VKTHTRNCQNAADKAGDGQREKTLAGHDFRLHLMRITVNQHDLEINNARDAFRQEDVMVYNIKT
jgi:hypothetical protein